MTIDEVALTHSYLDQTLAALTELSQTGASTPTGRASAPVPDFDEALARELESSLSAGAFEMVYQPIYDRTGTQIVSGRSPDPLAAPRPRADRAGCFRAARRAQGTDRPDRRNFGRGRALSDAAAWSIPTWR